MFDRLKSLVGSKPKPVFVQVSYQPLNAPIRAGRTGYTYRWVLPESPEIGARVLVPISGSRKLEEGFIVATGVAIPRGFKADEILDVHRVATPQDFARSKPRRK